MADSGDATRGSAPFTRRARTDSMLERLNAKPATKIVRLTGMFALLGFGAVYLVPAFESRGWSLEPTAVDAESWPVWSDQAEHRRLQSASNCYPNASSAATGNPECLLCMEDLIPDKEMTSPVGNKYTYREPVGNGARCYCKSEKTCKRADNEKAPSATNPCELETTGTLAGSCIKDDPPADCSTSFPAEWGWVPLYLVIIFYCFLGLAVVCDELFVPALEVMAEKMQLSNDVAGATLMAAGGSAPELATSLFGTFGGSDVGMGTIVGSAVFNVLFVIGMCAMATPPEFAPLKLTWWPLARDCSYYLITLVALYVWFSISSPGVITTLEAFIQFLLYIGYVVLMKFSEPLEMWVKSKFAKDEKVAPANGYSEEKRGSVCGESNFADPNADFNRPSTFRTGIYQLLTQSKSITETAGVHVVTRIKGDVNETFSTLDKNGNGYIDKEELSALFKQLAGADGKQMSDEELQKVYNQLDGNGDGTISKDEFIIWYTGSEQRLKDDVRKVFAELDANNTNTITPDELATMLSRLGHKATDKEISEIVAQINKTEGDISLSDFEAWYQSSLFWTQAQEAASDAQDAEAGMYASVMSGLAELGDPEKPFGAKAMFVVTLPLSLSFALTVPDCRPPGKEWLCWLTFFMSIVWIGGFTYPMVECATALGALLNIPVVIMGLTFLAAGTSVPDLLSSVIVAKQGQGDMAVSSSIGSNIFDVAVGLPLPWLLFSITYCPICVGTGGIVISLGILIAMVFLVIVTIAASGWQMTRTLGMAMFGMYFFFCLQDILRTYIVALGGDPDNIPC